MIRVVLADDHEMIRQALARILSETEGIRIVGQASDGGEALALVEKESPDVLVLDYSMPVLDAPSVIDTLHRRRPRVKILVLTVHENIHYAVKVLEGGAHAYVIKSAAVSELVDAIEAVHAGEIYISPKVSQKVIQHLRRPKRRRVGLESLSQREFELLRILGTGMGIKECARRLNVSVSTASTYRTRLMEKLDLQTTAEVIRFALENDIVG